MSHFYLDVLDGAQVIEDLDGIDFADRETALAEAAAGARDLVAHGIMQNQDVSGQSFLIRDNHGEAVATVPFEAPCPEGCGADPSPALSRHSLSYSPAYRHGVASREGQETVFNIWAQ